MEKKVHACLNVTEMQRPSSTKENFRTQKQLTVPKEKIIEHAKICYRI